MSASHPNVRVFQIHVGFGLENEDGNGKWAAAAQAWFLRLTTWRIREGDGYFAVIQCISTSSWC